MRFVRITYRYLFVLLVYRSFGNSSAGVNSSAGGNSSAGSGGIELIVVQAEIVVHALLFPTYNSIWWSFTTYVRGIKITFLRPNMLCGIYFDIIY